MLDSIVFEQVGVPTASIITDVFHKTGDAMARSWGLKNFRFLEMPHPIANLTRDEMHALALRHVEQSVRQLTA